MDHVFSNSWYPDTTPDIVQRWTVPSCPDCNFSLGSLEKDLLIRLSLCVDPNSSATVGVASRVMRTLGLDTGILSKREKGHREKLRAKFRLEVNPYSKFKDAPGAAIPGLGPHGDQTSLSVIAIPWASFAILTEKIVRGCEYKLRERFLEAPYSIRTCVISSDAIPEPLASFAVRYEFGPGWSFRRVFTAEDPNVVLYWISIWNTLHLHARIDLEEELQRLDLRLLRVEGLTLQQVQRAMRIPEYLRDPIFSTRSG